MGRFTREFDEGRPWNLGIEKAKRLRQQMRSTGVKRHRVGPMEFTDRRDVIANTWAMAGTHKVIDPTTPKPDDGRGVDDAT